ncbi:MAG TPA: hypothetical protein VLM89_11025 [Phycisphaerae bacterium]|nr:hypothetical protein [Phycisphaerae bacterium]
MSRRFMVIVGFAGCAALLLAFLPSVQASKVESSSTIQSASPSAQSGVADGSLVQDLFGGNKKDGGGCGKDGEKKLGAGCKRDKPASQAAP